jgi:hypothetical protein
VMLLVALVFALERCVVEMIANFCLRSRATDGE